MIVALMLAAAQAATPAPPAPPAATARDRTVVREIVIRDAPGDKAAGKDNKDKVERREIVIVRHGDGAKSADSKADRRIRIVDVQPGTDGGRREIRLLRKPGAAGERITMLDCAGSKVDSEATDKDGKKTRVMICAEGGSDVSRTQRLRDAAKRIQADTNLSEETRNRITLAINEAIAKLPASE